MHTLSSGKSAGNYLPFITDSGDVTSGDVISGDDPPQIRPGWFIYTTDE
jgi:hypothetical protein